MSRQIKISRCSFFLILSIFLLFPHGALGSDLKPFDQEDIITEEEKRFFDQMHEDVTKTDAAAQFTLAGMYAQGQGIQKNEEKAFKWCQKAAEQGYTRAQFNLGVLYAQGQGIPKDEEKAVQWFQKAAEQEDAAAQFNLSVMYAQGQGIQKNEEKAFKWCQKAAEQEDAAAQFNLSMMYAQGQGIQRNDEKAFKWCQKAVEQGDAAAQCNLGWRYAQGLGVPKNEAKAVEWFEKAAQQNYEDAQYNLGVMYEDGRGVPKEQKRAFEWYQKAAEQGHAKAQYVLGVRYEFGNGVLKEQKRAFEWYQKAAEQGHATAQYVLGVRYESGRDVLKDKIKAIELYEKAAQQNQPYAQNELGLRYALKKEKNQAVKWWQKARKRPNISSQYFLNLIDIFASNRQNLANLPVKFYFDALRQYFEQIRIEMNVDIEVEISQDFYTSKASLKEGLEKKKKEAFHIFGLLNLLDIGVKQDIGEGSKYLRYAARENHLLATYMLQYIYERGLGVVTDCFETLKWQVITLQQFNVTSIDTSLLESVLKQFPHSWSDGLKARLQSTRLPLFLENIKTTNSAEAPPERKTLFSEIKNDYDVFLFDIGGVVTDGVKGFPYAADTVNRLAQEEVKKVIFLSNSARPKEVTQNDLIKKGIYQDLFIQGIYQGMFEEEFNPEIFLKNIAPKICITTAGELALCDLRDVLQNEKIYHFSFGENRNRDILKGMDDRIVNLSNEEGISDNLEKAGLVLLTQFIEKKQDQTEDQLFEPYEDRLRRVAERAKNGCPILCVNPDITAFHGPTTIRYCAGAFAQRLIEKYEVPKEKITYYGKPDKKIYKYIEKTVFKDAQFFKKSTVMIGDSLENDILGAKEFGIDSILVLTGNAKREIKEHLKGEQDIWHFLADYYDRKQAKPKYFMESLTDEF